VLVALQLPIALGPSTTSLMTSRKTFSANTCFCRMVSDMVQRRQGEKRNANELLLLGRVGRGSCQLTLGSAAKQTLILVIKMFSRGRFLYYRGISIIWISPRVYN